MNLLLTWPILAVSILLILASLALVAFILLHHNRGGGLSDLFGGGMSTSMGGASAKERALDRMTIIAGIVWIVCIILLLVFYRFFPQFGVLG